MIRYLACAAVVATLPFSALAQYKCIAPSGSVSFQQTPCAAGARSQKLDLPAVAPASPTDMSSAAERSAREVAAVDWRVAVRRAIDSRYPIVGMTVGELVQAVGHPRTINTADYGRGFEEQRIYVGAQRTWYVYTRAGVVTAVQDVAGGDPVLAKQENCPSDQWVRDEETSLSSKFALDRDRRLTKLNEILRLCGFVR